MVREEYLEVAEEYQSLLEEEDSGERAELQLWTVEQELEDWV